jgi:hypothetical protein
MYILGILLFIASTAILFGSDIMVKRGKIKDAKQLLKIKSIGLGILFLSVIFMLLK